MKMCLIHMYEILKETLFNLSNDILKCVSNVSSAEKHTLIK